MIMFIFFYAKNSGFCLEKIAAGTDDCQSKANSPYQEVMAIHGQMPQMSTK
jgi:hypothetical protein